MSRDTAKTKGQGARVRSMLRGQVERRLMSLRFLCAALPLSGLQGCPFLPGREEDIITRETYQYILLLGRSGEQRVPLESAVSQLPLAQNSLFAKMAYLGVGISDPVET